MTVVVLSIVAGAVYVAVAPDRITGVALALLGGAVTVFLTRLESEFRKPGAPMVELSSFVAASFGWMAVSGLVSWGRRPIGCSRECRRPLPCSSSAGALLWFSVRPESMESFGEST
jgi:hypothetical protein